MKKHFKEAKGLQLFSARAREYVVVIKYLIYSYWAFLLPSFIDSFLYHFYI
jgi:hypothetical protein